MAEKRKAKDGAKGDKVKKSKKVKKAEQPEVRDVCRWIGTDLRDKRARIGRA